MMKSVLLFSALLALSSVACLNNGLALTPQMGWNSWNHYGCSVTGQIIRDTITAIAKSPLKDAGYIYVNVDDCWAGYRNSTGYIQPDPTTFSMGMAALADHAHTFGLKFGLYSDAGTKTCAGRPGSLGYETKDAESYSSWNVDYLKYDNCNNDGIPVEKRYPVMRDALNSTKHKIFYSMCEWGVDNPATWAPTVGNSWRTTGDISDNWASMLSNIDNNNQWASYAAIGGWNDPDMLEIGNGGMTTTEYISHFSLWCLSKAPLLIGCDVTNMDATTLKILTAKEVIAVNQDPLGVQGKKVYIDGTSEVWAGPLAKKEYAVLLFNRGSSAVQITALWKYIGLTAGSRYTVRDLWLEKNVGVYSDSYGEIVPAHGVVMVKLTPA